MRRELSVRLFGEIHPALKDFYAWWRLETPPGANVSPKFNDMEKWNQLTTGQKEEQVRQIKETYNVSDYANAENMAYNIRLGYENDPDWFFFEVSDLNAFQTELARLLRSEFPPIVTMEALVDYINAYDEWPLDVEDIIEQNGWTSDTHEKWGVCHDENRKVLIDDNGIAYLCND